MLDSGGLQDGVEVEIRARHFLGVGGDRLAHGLARQGCCRDLVPVRPPS